MYINMRCREQAFLLLHKLTYTCIHIQYKYTYIYIYVYSYIYKNERKKHSEINASYQCILECYKEKILKKGTKF